MLHACSDLIALQAAAQQRLEYVTDDVVPIGEVGRQHRADLVIVISFLPIAAVRARCRRRICPRLVLSFVISNTN
jgi:hypothetical protein